MPHVIEDGCRKREAPDHPTDPIGGIAKHAHQHVRHAIGVATLHPAASREVVEPLNAKKKQRRNDRGERAVSMTHVENCLEYERSCDYGHYMPHEKIADKVVGHALDPSRVLRAVGSLN